MHKSGFVNIIGRPNVGKSTLMNALVGERMSIITNKPQTTRHRIIGIVSDEDYQIVFSDTPGIIEDPAYRMQEAMNSFVKSSFEDADVMLWLIEAGEMPTTELPLANRLKKLEVPLFLVINKVDLVDEAKVAMSIKNWSEQFDFTEIIPISALKKLNTDRLLQLIIEHMPEGPVYYPKDQLTDKPERFFVSEIIREKILMQYKQEIPYSCEVVVESFKETQNKAGAPLVRISALIYVGRKTQKSIIIGKGGSAIKRLGTEARKDIERFLEQKVFLELHVKVRDNWRNDEQMLKHFGYQ
ncbi:MAG: GTPase Era [Bacteroidota bacterium]